MDYVVNPLTKRRIKIGSKKYRDLIEQNVIPRSRVRHMDHINKIIDEIQVPLKPCPQNKVRNPISKHCIDVNGATYKKLVKQGVDFLDEKTNSKKETKRVKIIKIDVQHIKAVKAANSKNQVKEVNEANEANKASVKTIKALSSVKASVKTIKALSSVKTLKIVKAVKIDKAATIGKTIAKSCLNKTTFLYQEHIHNVIEADFLRMPSGYCFSVEELVDWINSGTFTNQNPYDENAKLFTEEEFNKKAWQNNPILENAIKTYFESEIKKNKEISRTILKYIDTLYKLGNLGRICYYDHITSFEEDDSSTFEYSIASINAFTEHVNSLPKDVQKIFNGLATNNYTLEKLIDDSNKGNLCIHGMGSKCIRIFIKTFMNLELIHKIVYDPIKTGMYFVPVTKDGGTILLYNIELRYIHNTRSDYYLFNIRKIFKMSSNPKTSLLWDVKKIQTNGLTKEFNANCPNDAYIATLDSDDDWKSVHEWRKIKTEDGYCFDLLFLIRTITDQLNTTKNANPFPRHPSNIFTRKNLSYYDLLSIRRRIVNNFMKVSPGLLKFLYNFDQLFSIDETYTESGRWREKCIGLFENDLRYERRMNAEKQITGNWVMKTHIQSPHEQRVLSYLNTADINILNRLAPSDVEENYYYRDTMGVTFNWDLAFTRQHGL